MTKRRPGHAPRVVLDITSDIIANAKRAHSGACVIADAIKAQVPNATRIAVDLRFIAWSDQEAGERYTYLTPVPGQVSLFAFDRGVTPPPMTLPLGKALQVSPIVRAKGRAVGRAVRMAELERKEREGTITHAERRGLTRMRSVPVRPETEGSRTIVDGTIVGGAPPTHGANIPGAHATPPQLLPSHARTFGARKANASQLDALLDAARAEGYAVGREVAGDEVRDLTGEPLHDA